MRGIKEDRGNEGDEGRRGIGRRGMRRMK